MKRQVVTVVAIFVGLALADELYSTENDNFDIEALVASPAEFDKFIGCFLDKNPCNAIAADFKKDMNEVFQQSCSKCTVAQKHLLNRFLAEMKKQRPQDLEIFKKKYDPEAKYFELVEKAVEKF